VERGIVAWNQTHQGDSSATLDSDEVYDLPFGISSFLHAYSWTGYIPFCPPRIPRILDTNHVEVKQPPEDLGSTHVIVAVNL